MFKHSLGQSVVGGKQIIIQYNLHVNRKIFRISARNIAQGSLAWRLLYDYVAIQMELNCLAHASLEQP